MEKKNPENETKIPIKKKNWLKFLSTNYVFIIIYFKN